MTTSLMVRQQSCPTSSGALRSLGKISLETPETLRFSQAPAAGTSVARLPRWR